jgi:hypothetical protein
MPTKNRRDYVRAKARKEFRAGRSLVDSAEIQEALIFAKDNLDIARAQRKHLCKVLKPDHESTQE